MLVAKGYRYDHAAVHASEYGFPGERRPHQPRACLRTPGAEEVTGTSLWCSEQPGQWTEVWTDVLPQAGLCCRVRETGLGQPARGSGRMGRGKLFLFPGQDLCPRAENVHTSPQSWCPNSQGTQPPCASPARSPLCLQFSCSKSPPGSAPPKLLSPLPPPNSGPHQAPQRRPGEALCWPHPAPRSPRARQ